MLTLTDLFCGAGGSSTGAIQVPGVEVRMAANHWDVAIELHNANHQDTDHATVDLHEEDPDWFPKTDMLWASPECTKWSSASGKNTYSSIEEGLFEDPLSDDAATRSRLLMFDVLKFIDRHRYRLVFVENVVDIAIQAKYRTAWDVWRQELRKLGYNFRVVSLNSMHAQLYGLPAAQSRDRIYIVAWPEGERAPDLDQVNRPLAYCDRCDSTHQAVQSWKRGRDVGRYRQAYLYCCPTCGGVVEPYWMPAASIIDWTMLGERIGDRAKPLAEKTLNRIAHGIARYWGPVHLEASGNQYDAADPKHRNHGALDAYYRAWPMSDPLKALHTTNSKALAVPVEGRDGKQASPLSDALRTQTTRHETALAHMPFIAEMRGTSTARAVDQPAGTFTAGGNHHALVTQFRQRENRNLDPYRDPLNTIVADGASHALVMSYYSRDDAMKPAHDPLATITTEPRHALLTRHYSQAGDPSHLTTPTHEYLRTLTTTAQQSIMERPGQVTAADLAEAREMIPDVLFRMFTPGEVAAGMAFPDDYIWQPANRARPVSNRDLVKAAGNAVTPPASRDIIGASIQSIGAAK